MLRNLLLSFAATSLCLAQYVTTDDGSRLFFTSFDRLAGSSQSFRSKLFSWDAERGVQLVYEAPAEYVCCASITGDGLLAAFVLDNGGDPPQRRGALLNLHTGQLEIVGKNAIISRNGRYLFTGDGLLDRVMGVSRPVSVPAAFVGNDGSLLYKDLDALHRIDPDGTDRAVMRPLRTGYLTGADENAATAVVILGPLPPVLVDTITGRQWNLGNAGASTGAAARLSRDGQWVAFFAVRPASDPGYQVKLCRADGSDCKVLANAVDPSSPVAISGDADTVYSIDRNQVVRIDTASGRTERAFAITSFSPLGDGPIVPGSLVRFYAVNAGDRITVNGREMPVLSQPGASPFVQVPWDLPDQWVKFTMYGGDSLFETFTRTYPVSDFYPQGFIPGSPIPNEGQPAYRQDWSATTYDSPALPGEIVHIYAVGLGAVDCPVETGKPAPLDRLCRITISAEWNWITAPGVTVPAEVLFAGLAPGMVGLYQIDIRLPPYNGYQFITLSDGVRNPRVAFVRMRPE